MKSKDRNHQAGNWVNSYNNVMQVYVSKPDGAKYTGILIIMTVTMLNIMHMELFPLAIHMYITLLYIIMDNYISARPRPIMPA